LNALGAGEHGGHTDVQKHVQKELEDLQKVLAETSTEVEVLRKMLVCTHTHTHAGLYLSLYIYIYIYIYIYACMYIYIGRGEAYGVGARDVSVAGT
jgi:hypothetical protein